VSPTQVRQGLAPRCSSGCPHDSWGQPTRAPSIGAMAVSQVGATSSANRGTCMALPRRARCISMPYSQLMTHTGEPPTSVMPPSNLLRLRNQVPEASDPGAGGALNLSGEATCILIERMWFASSRPQCSLLFGF
jgi:hypothetical protein